MAVTTEQFCLNLHNGLIEQARQSTCPHYDDRECDDIDLLVIHNISLPPSQFGGPYIDQFFAGCLDPEVDRFFKEIAGIRVSSHLLIRRDGELVQYVPFHKRAWHAGVSSFNGREKCNDFSIGIELEGTDEIPYEDIQYEVLAKVTKLLMTAYPKITQDRITGHCNIAPGRKTDPGPAFDWEHYFRFLPDFE
ncbi:1,6-anhydro-N-acetylmuramyl-L-alanine amidase AmpD [Kangiella sediminilitoris]|uniref:1,6-anhydro-N-acetylmuramyl-L-alanine amidase AmpD n=1 Tax=Kangiella sediminilitoris TaxID=1144748 RepID=A0A1B3BCF9_9GAMM|nr:1,6-anhydro-N-acetylmuramyl-L-alanine amidase AmpD [Kangiella sediminilitoris]AOE50445.1 N-acetylmuramyl-L-alanine amidase, negative regulator of AmpC, AmpD [Kangiella sediminilitoris]